MATLTSACGGMGGDSQDLWDLEAGARGHNPNVQRSLSTLNPPGLKPVTSPQHGSPRKLSASIERKVGKLMFARQQSRATSDLAVGKLDPRVQGTQPNPSGTSGRGLESLTSTASLSIRLQVRRPRRPPHSTAPAMRTSAVISTQQAWEQTTRSCTAQQATASVRLRTHPGVIRSNPPRPSAPWKPNWWQRSQAGTRGGLLAAELIEEMGVPQQRPTPSSPTASPWSALMENRTRLQRSKHATRLHWLRHAQDTGIIRLVSIPRHSDADGITSPVSPRARSLRTNVDAVAWRNMAVQGTPHATTWPHGLHDYHQGGPQCTL